MKARGTMLLARNDVTTLLTLKECIVAVRRAFEAYGSGRMPPPAILGLHVPEGEFHVKAGALGFNRPFVAVKLNANFPGNRERWGLPTIQGVIVLCDAVDGTLLAIMDSIQITILRTGAATAVAAACLARPESTVLTLCGCGNQGRVQLRSLLTILPLRHAFVYDTDAARAITLANEFSGQLRVEPVAADGLRAAIRVSDVCCTCTPSTAFYIRREDVRPGTFIAAVGADSESKQELDPLLFRDNTIVADIVDQCAAIGDLHHAIAGGVVSKADVHAELGQIVAGRRPGRSNNEEIIIFDSTGMALQDAAAAIVVYENARRAHLGRSIEFSTLGTGEARPTS